MKQPTRTSTRRLVAASLATLGVAISLTVAGCGKPSAANIQLRKQVQDLQAEIETLKRARDADAATIASLQQSKGSVPTLPQDRLAKLYTVHGLQLGRLTGGADLDAATAGDEGIEIQVVPTDDEGQVLKAAGMIVVEAFDLSNTASPLLGRWEYSAEQTRKAWVGAAMQYTYSMKMPWQTPPTRTEVTLKISFTDELTGRLFTQQKVVQVKLPAPPTTAPGGA